VSQGSRIRVKLLTPGPAALWQHQFPGGNPIWGDCEFLFDREEEDYDWVVVYDDVPPRRGESRDAASEWMRCPAEHSVLVTTEPSSIKNYGTEFVRQFGVVLTSQEPWALPHPQRIYAQPALHWFYGVGESAFRPFDQIASGPAVEKTRGLSMVFSPKAMRHTLHGRRHDFMKALMKHLPQLEVFGRGARPLDDKADALDAYRYHVAVENHLGLHHWTEKLADPFLGLCLPFYAGCPNVADYFPPESYIPIDLDRPEASAEIIRSAMAGDEYRRRLPAIRKARDLVLYEYNLFAVLSREITRRHCAAAASTPGRLLLLSRHALRKGSWKVRFSDLAGKVRVRARSLLRNR
jgi:hypothetical protein